MFSRVSLKISKSLRSTGVITLRNESTYPKRGLQYKIGIRETAQRAENILCIWEARVQVLASYGLLRTIRHNSGVQSP